MLNWLSGRRELKVRERALQESEEMHRGNSSDGGTGREEPSPPPSTIGDIESGHHVCCIYETEEEHRAVVVPFLRQGLERGEKVLYIVDARDAEIILDYLREDGLDPDPYLESGQLSVLTAQEVYLKDGVFDPDAMIALLRAETDQALAEGYATLRVTGEMSWALRGLPGSERLIEYEAKLNQFFPGSKCLAICQYDRRAFSASLLLDVLTTHPIAVVGTSVHDNLYYVPAAGLLGPDPQATRLRVWMEHLSERKRRNEALREASAELGLWAKTSSINTRDITVPDEIVRKWQSVVNVMAELVQVPAALIMKVEPPYIDVFSSSESSHNPFKAGARYDLAGLYCQKVIQAKRKHLVPNALKDKEWDSNPDLECGMISYLGFPLVWPDGQVFGTICVSDTKENRYGEQYERLILRFKELAESHLDQLYRSRELEQAIAERKRTEEALRERIKELNCLYGISKLLETPGISLEQVLQGTADLLPPSWQYPEVACARIVLEDQEFKTENFKESPWRQASDITLSGEQISSVEVCYLEERPESDEGPFLKEERRLINAVAERLCRIVQRKRAEQERSKANERTGALIRAIPDMMFVARGDGTYLDFLPADGQQPLVPPSELLGRTVREVMPTGLARRMMHYIEAALESGEVHRFEYELDVEDEKHHYECRFVAMAVDEVLAIARDVTAEKRLEQEQARRRARDELEGKVERAMLGRNPYGLTFREFSVLHLVARGAADKEIADNLGISTFTVNKHVANILGKMNASCRTEAGVRAHREGLIS